MVLLQPSVPAARADVTNIDADDTSIDSPDTVQITVDLSAATDTVTITATGDSTSFLALTVDDCNPDCDEGDFSDFGDGSATVTVTEDNVTEITLTIGITCEEDDTITVTATQNTSEAVDIDCNAGGGGGVIGSGGQVVVEADPNLLPCKGGTSEITARVLDLFGDEVSDLGFHFSTTAGLIEKTSKNTADLTLGPGQTSATVTATIFDPPNDPDDEGEVKSATVTVSLACNSFVAVVVTAEPNVVQCGGVSVLTATARDSNGHVVSGVGFHFATNTGLLVVSPNNAKTDKGVAQLSLLPSMPSSTVKVSVGTLQGTVEDTVTVQNYCPGVSTNQDVSIATGVISLTSSKTTVGCGETVFIGARVADSKNQIVPDGTSVRFLTTKGSMVPSEGSTSNGVLNVAFQATEGTSGPVTITAASGDKYGTLQLNVACGASGVAGANGSVPCTPIGDGVCIRPPSTGDGGLAE
jgi:hypothetical protein